MSTPLPPPPFPSNHLAEVADKKAQARVLFFERKPAQEICALVAATPSQLKRWRTEGEWDGERDVAERGLLEEGFSQGKLTVVRIKKLAGEQILRGLKAIAERHDPPTIPELEKISTIYANLDKISRLDSNRATENVSIEATVKMTAQEIREVLLNNPFLSPPKPETPSPDA